MTYALFVLSSCDFPTLLTLHSINYRTKKARICYVRHFTKYCHLSVLVNGKFCGGIKYAAMEKQGNCIIRVRRTVDNCNLIKLKARHYLILKYGKMN